MARALLHGPGRAGLTSDLESARRDWAAGYARLQEATADAVARDRLDHQVEAVLRALRRRLGSSFTLVELADTYAGAEPWVHEAVAENAPVQGWPGTLSIAADAAFHLYARGAVDYSP